MNRPAAGWTFWGRRPADFLLFGVTAAELAFLVWPAPRLTITDWIYVCSHLLVLVIALTRRSAQAQDRTIAAGAAVLVSYTYSYAQVLLLDRTPGTVAWPAGGIALVLIGALLSMASLISLGRSFGARPALRRLAMNGTYRVVRHPMYLSYVIQDIGYNLHEWSVGSLLLVAVGWASLVYRIRAEERVLSGSAEWDRYAARARFRLLPGIW